jgi:hypothetical protein
MHHLSVAAIALASTLLPQHHGDHPPASPTPGVAISTERSSEAATRARMLDALLNRKVTIELEEVPARQAIKSLRDSLEINLIGRWRDDSTGRGMDPEARITLQLLDVPALDALEAILDQCAMGEPCTWQLRSSFVEVGTKERLAAPSAREMRRYDIQDMLLDPPMFENSAFGTGTIKRKGPEEIAAGVIVMIVDTIEPEAWKDAPAPPYEPGDGRQVSTPSAPNQPVTAPSRNLDPDEGQIRVVGQWATVHYWKGSLFVNAPDFVHRGIGGYVIPKPSPPQDAADPAGSVASP